MSRSESPWVVHKFGGSSLANAAAYRAVGEIVARERGPRTAVVVSAMSGVTDGLIRLVELASARDASWAVELRGMRQRQREVVGDLLAGGDAERLSSVFESDVHDVEDVLRAIWLMRSRPDRAVDLVSGYGELWSAQVLAAHLMQRGLAATWLDAREVLTVSAGELARVVDWQRSRAAAAARFRQTEESFVVLPGYVASDPSGLPTTLGRNGSDYSASIFASLLDASGIHIWTDVDGVLSADPRQVPEAVVIERLSYDEAMELAYFGAKVLHPATMAPAVERSIPIVIRNTFRPEGAGTRIHDESPGGMPVKGFATIGGMALVNVEGTGMLGVPGVAERLFRALREAGVSVVMISQGSSEHSICFAIPQAHTDRARHAVEQAFFAERHQGQVRDPDVKEGCAILAAVGDRMAGTPGVAARLFGALGRAGVNVRAIAQGSSERNISVVLDEPDAVRALRAAHAGFYLSSQTLSIGLLGPGLVGATLLSQLGRQLERLRSERRIDLRVRGIMTRSRMLLDERCISVQDWRRRFEADAVAADLDRFVEHVHTDSMPHAAVVDCTASDEIARRYADWLASGVHVITPNKKANTLELDYLDRIRDSARRSGVHYLYETTVGAGLPVIETLRDLIQTGDEVLGIEGILSGTLSYLFNAFDGTRPFSTLVREAKELGYTEPDPRDDLSGTDVARKVVILARELGLRVSLDDLDVESVVPAELAAGPAGEFLDRLAAHDEPMERARVEAAAAGEVLRYVGAVDPAGRSYSRLARYPADHPFARLRPTDNVVLFRTRRYHDNPLVVQGPGAGPEVTAGGVFADLLRLAAYLGATS